MRATTFRLQLTQLERRDVPSAPDLFNSDFYLRSNPDVAVAVRLGLTTPEEHFRQFGDAEGRSGNPMFDTDFYLAHNTDVRTAVTIGRITPFTHFELFGEYEKRDPCEHFNTADYLRLYSDVRGAVATQQTAAFEHFYSHGQYEGRLPVHGFARRDYLNDNHDVDTAVNHDLKGAVVHFMNFGRHENRQDPIGRDLDWPTTEIGPIGEQSEHSEDVQLFSITPPVSGTVTVSLTFTGERPEVSVESGFTNVPMYQRPSFPLPGLMRLLNSRFNSGEPYVLRIRSSGDSALSFTFTLSVA